MSPIWSIVAFSLYCLYIQCFTTRRNSFPHNGLGKSYSMRIIWSVVVGGISQPATQVGARHSLRTQLMTKDIVPISIEMTARFCLRPGDPKRSSSIAGHSNMRCR
ncbi:hypothetical protein V8C42DRAFT_334248 [Trichoderma barbatum]